MRIEGGRRRDVAEWVASRIEGAYADDFGDSKVPHLEKGSYEAVSVMSESRRMLAGVVYHGYRPANRTIEMSIAASTPRWATPSIIRQLLFYPFGQLGVEKAVAVIQTNNERSLRLVKGLGFEHEATLRRHIAGKDVAICSMFRETWLERWYRGQQQIRAEAA